MPQQHGRLFLLPSPIVEGDLTGIPQHEIQVLHGLRYYIVERERTARRFIAATKPPVAIDELHLYEMPVQPETMHQAELQLKPLLEGHDLGILSEAGLPAVADPGNVYVAAAHQLGIEVIPLPGPSSMMMALMASGLQGQRFAFHGYLSPRKDELIRQLKDLEHRADRDDATQLFMETPYRNHQIIEAVEKAFNPERMFCIAAGIGGENAFIRTRSVKEWKKSGWPEIHKVPAVFLLR